MTTFFDVGGTTLHRNDLQRGAEYIIDQTTPQDGILNDVPLSQSKLVIFKDIFRARGGDILQTSM